METYAEDQWLFQSLFDELEQDQFEILLLETRALYPHRSLDILWTFHDVPSRLRNEKIAPESIFWIKWVY